MKTRVICLANITNGSFEIFSPSSRCFCVPSFDAITNYSDQDLGEKREFFSVNWVHTSDFNEDRQQSSSTYLVNSHQ